MPKITRRYASQAFTKILKNGMEILLKFILTVLREPPSSRSTYKKGARRLLAVFKAKMRRRAHRDSSRAAKRPSGSAARGLRPPSPTFCAYMDCKSRAIHIRANENRHILSAGCVRQASLSHAAILPTASPGRPALLLGTAPYFFAISSRRAR